MTTESFTNPVNCSLLEYSLEKIRLRLSGSRQAFSLNSLQVDSVAKCVAAVTCVCVCVFVCIAVASEL
jgi:hypothetical protein